LKHRIRKKFDISRCEYHTENVTELVHLIEVVLFLRKWVVLMTDGCYSVTMLQLQLLQFKLPYNSMATWILGKQHQRR